MLALLASLLMQSAPADVTKLGVHDLARAIPRLGDHSFDLSREKEPPLSVRAQDELRERIRRGAVLDLADWQTILLEKGYLQHRERWPKTEPFAIGLHVPPICTGLSIELAPRTLGWSKVTATDSDGVGCMGGAGRGDQVLGALFWTDRQAVFDLSVTMPLQGQGDPKPALESRTDYLGSISIPVQAVNTLEEAVPRVVDRKLDDTIRHLLATGPCVVIEREPGKPAHAFVRLGLESHPQAVLLALRCTALENGQARSTADLPLGPSLTAGFLLDLPESVVLSKETARDWALKFTGCNTTALREWDATQYWAGEIEVPLADLIRH